MSASLARDPVFVQPVYNTLSPIITPITTIDEVLGPDKGRVHMTGSSKNVTAASLKSFQILSKFWGDEIDTDPATDSTMEPETATASESVKWGDLVDEETDMSDDQEQNLEGDIKEGSFI